MITLRSSSGSIAGIGHDIELYADGNCLGLHWVSLNADTDQYVTCQLFVPNDYPSHRVTRFYFVGDWYDGDETSDLTMKVSVWHKGELDDMETPDIVDDDITVYGADQNQRIPNFYYDIPEDTINGNDFVKLVLRRNFVVGDGRKLRISAVRVETL